MKIKQKIGIVGNGYVGGAVRYGFSPNVGCDAEVRTYDKDPNRSTHTLEETVNESDFIFLSVPTPANDSTPSYTFNSNEAGTITYGGSCSSSDNSTSSSGNKSIDFRKPNGTVLFLTTSLAL